MKKNTQKKPAPRGCGEMNTEVIKPIRKQPDISAIMEFIPEPGDEFEIKKAGFVISGKTTPTKKKVVRFKNTESNEYETWTIHQNGTRVGTKTIRP